MAQWVEMLGTKSDSLRFISRAHMVKERTDPGKLSSDFHMYTMPHVCIHSYMGTIN